MVSEPRGAAPREGGSTPPPLARLPRRCGSAGPAARRRDVTVAAAVVGAGSAAAKCELRRARAGGGVKSGSGGGVGRGQDRGRSWCLHPSPARAGSRCWLQLCVLAPLCSVFAPLLLRCPPTPRPGPSPLGRTAWGRRGFPSDLAGAAVACTPGAGRALVFVNCRRGRRSAFPPAAPAECWGGGGVSAASRPGVGARPPCPRLGPAPPSRGPFQAQGPAAAAGRAPRGGRAGVFNGSMLPAAGAASGQAGPPARPQPPRSHQLQLQLRALRLPQSPAALPGKRRRRGPHTWGLLFCLPPSTWLHLRDPYSPVLAVHPPDQHFPLFGDV